MATHTLTCHGCQEPFEAKSPLAKWCKPGCKKRLQRHPELATESSPDVTPHDGPDTGLVAEVRRELEAAGRVHTFAGQLALSLAQKVSAIDATGVSGLSKELRAVRAEALADLPTPLAGAEPAPPDEDEVEKARRRRDEARKAAGLA